MTHELKLHALNVIGDFYVEDGCCTACEVPQSEAPDLFGMTPKPNYHCYVKRQPQTDAERDQMLSAILCAELQCIHYRGNNPAIISRLSAMGEMDVCDTTPPSDIELGLRTHVTFATKQSTDLTALASSFKRYIKSQRGEYSRILFPWRSTAPTTVKYNRNETGWHAVQFGRHNDCVHVSHIVWKLRLTTAKIRQVMAAAMGGRSLKSLMRKHH